MLIDSGESATFEKSKADVSSTLQTASPGRLGGSVMVLESFRVAPAFITPATTLETTLTTGESSGNTVTTTEVVAWREPAASETTTAIVATALLEPSAAVTLYVAPLALVGNEKMPLQSAAKTGA